MPRYLLAYHGGHVDESQEGRERVMKEFGEWFAELGPRLIDPGNPIARAVTVDGGTVSDRGGSNPVSGYTVIDADDMGPRSSSSSVARSSRAAARWRSPKPPLRSERRARGV